ncbi:MAG TPA: hypothetical protein VFQ54_11305, partial [Thermomicrobiales bacterium]|nr:hypothetical protein [Thermomicrobiales bacterium]
VFVLCGVSLVMFAAPPTKWFVVVEETNGDWRPTIVAAAMLPLYVIIMSLPGLRTFFGLNLLESWLYVLIAVVVPGWMIALRYVWKNGIFDRFIDSPVPSKLIDYLERDRTRRPPEPTERVVAVTPER